MAQNFIKKARGFTLIEILVVIGIIAILATIVIIAINPAKQFAQARDTQRESNVNTILNAVGQNIADNKGIFSCNGTNNLPSGLASSTINIGGGNAAGHVDLSCLAPTYVPTFPTDPDTGYAVAPYTGYDVSVNAVGRVLVCADRSTTETSISTPGPTICVKR